MMHAKRKAIAVLGAVLAPAAVAVPSASAAPATPPPPWMTTGLASGTGGDCVVESVKQSLDRESVTVDYADFQARAGGDSDPSDFRRTCQVSLRVDLPQGFTFGIAKIDFVGTADLAEGAHGRLKEKYYFEGRVPTQSVTHVIPAPHSGHWLFVDEIPVGQMIFKPCGEDLPLHLDNELWVHAGTSDPSKTNVLALDSTDDRVTYHLAWKLCNQ